MDELDELISHSFEDIKKGSLISVLLKLAKERLNLPYTDCENEHRRYYDLLKTIKPNQKLVKMEQQTDYIGKKFILKPGKLLYYNNTHFNNDTLKDNIAENAVKKFPELIHAFLNEKEIAVLKAMVDAKGSVEKAEAAAKNKAEVEVEKEPKKKTPKEKNGNE